MSGRDIEELCWNFDEVYIKSIDCFCRVACLYYNSTTQSCAWEYFHLLITSSNSLVSVLMLFIIQVFTCLVKVTTKYFILFLAIMRGFIFLILSQSIFHLGRKATDFLNLFFIQTFHWINFIY